MAKQVLIPIADGTEEIEAVCLIDVLRRAGAEVTVAGIDRLNVTAARGVRITLQHERERVHDAQGFHDRLSL